VTWRDGVHLTSTPIWCDARRRRDVCFVSAADRIGRAGHGQLIGTAETIAMLGGASAGDLAVPLRKPFTLGTLRLELIASGRGFGAASLQVDLGTRRVLYAGPVRTSDVVQPAEVRACDALVVAAPIGEARHRLPARGDAAARVAEWAREKLAHGLTPHLVVDSILDGFEVAGDLAAAGIDVVATAALRVPGGPALRAPGRDRHAVVRLASDRPRAREQTRSHVFALVSLRALEPARGFNAQFPWPFATDRAQLLAWIDQSGAREVFVTGSGADAIAAALGPRARVLGPPQQMTLFREAQ
jgi:hypothetical protein